MNTEGSEGYIEQEVDQAVSVRLARLRSLPTDTSQLDRMIHSHIPQPTQSSRSSRWLQPFRAIAASFVLLAAVVTAVLLSTSTGPVEASAAQMALVHQQIVSGQIPVMRVDSIEAANRMLSASAPDAPSLPQIPREHVMACCMKSVHDKKMACLLLKDEGVPITLVVARAADVHLSSAPLVVRDGLSYRVQTVGKLQMVMTERDGKWLCLMGEVPAERLMGIATKVQF